jgi:5-(carboxyamino)imidazole ribonucleotide mutase/phosphoribosylaminoimidazole-succinocarboxamide synthase
MSGFVVILMGSKSDLSHAQAIQQALNEFGIESVMRIGSAHKVPAQVLAMLQAYETDPRPKVYITIAGRSNALSGFTDAQVSAPVIACPPYSDRFGGSDIFSSLRMPGGVAPATVLEPAGAALLAAKILGLNDEGIRASVRDLQAANVRTLEEADASLQDGR